MRRYLRYFLAPVVVLAGSAVVLSTWFQPIVGDLTRIGSFSERDFGWNSRQPVIHVLANGKAVAHSEVLVLGDSFSVLNVWQSVVSARSGHTTLTYTYDQIACPSSWLDYALAQPGPDTVIVETVERLFVARYTKLKRCGPQPPPTVQELQPSETEAMRTTWPPVLYPNYTFRTALNTWKLQHTPGQFRSGMVINTPLKPDCAAFSSHRADRLLYYSQDNLKLAWTAQDLADAVANIKKVQDEFAAHGKKFIFVLVPDKSSVYRDCLADDPGSAARRRVNTTQALLAAGVNTPDLMGAFQQNANHITDLYLPDNTHVGPAGYILMANQIAPLLPPVRTAYAAR